MPWLPTIWAERDGSTLATAFLPLPFATTYIAPNLSDSPSKILYCRCAFAHVVPEATKNEVLEKLIDSGVNFESVADLCEMSARKDPRLQELLAGDGPVRIIACYPRAVKWMFHHAGVSFPEEDRVEVVNMRELSADEVMEQVLQPEPVENAE